MRIGIGALAGLSGLGDCIGGYDDTTGDPCVDTSTGSVVDQSNNLCGGMSAAQCAGALNAATGTTAPPPSASASSSSLWAQLTQSLTNIAAPIVKQSTTQAPYFITNPATGQSVLYTPSTGAVSSGVASTGLSSLFGTSATGSSDLFPLLLIGGLLLVVMEGKH